MGPNSTAVSETKAPVLPVQNSREFTLDRGSLAWYKP